MKKYIYSTYSDLQHVRPVSYTQHSILDVNRKMLGIAVLVIVLPLLLYAYSLFIKRVPTVQTFEESSFGRYSMNGLVFIRGVIIDINKEDRILTIKTSGDFQEMIVVNSGTSYILKLKPIIGGSSKPYKGDYFTKLSKGDLLNVELSPDTVFAKRILKYDMEKLDL